MTAGIGFTVKITLAVPVQPDEVPVTVYVVLITGLATTTAPPVEFNPLTGDHRYAEAPEAVSVTLSPAHRGEGTEGVMFIVRLEFTFTTTLVVEEHPDDVPVTV